jgi:hypothetical protein
MYEVVALCRELHPDLVLRTKFVRVLVSLLFRRASPWS